MRSSFLDRTMVLASGLGNNGIIWIVFILFLFAVRRYRRYGIAVGASLMLSMVICAVLKIAVHRIRPCDINTAVQLLIARPTDFSFPSGHTTASFAVTTALFYYRNRLWIPAGIVSVFIGFSRLYLYVHFPSDVLGGILLGITGAVSACTFCRRKIFFCRQC